MMDIIKCDCVLYLRLDVRPNAAKNMVDCPQEEL